MHANGDGSEQLGSEQLARHFAHRVDFFAHKVARMFLLGSRWQDELVSAGYWGLAKALDNRRSDASHRELSAYVSQRIIGAVIDEARRCLNRAGVEATSPGAESPGAVESWEDPSPSPEQALVDRSVWQEIEGALSFLDAEQRLMLRSYLDGASIIDMADGRGIPVGTMRLRFQKAAQQLRGRAPHVRRMLREADS
jgi:RNA polymerase sigma factor (sigma-70 family)